MMEDFEPVVVGVVEVLCFCCHVHVRDSKL